MKKILELLKAREIMCEIYENISESDKFYVGIIKSFDGEMFIFESISQEGNFDGFYCTSVDSIIAINYDTIYLKNLSKTASKRADKICFDNVNVLSGFLSEIKSKNALCELELLNDYSRALVGYIEKIDGETLSVKLINEHGIRDGVGIVKINDISCVAFDTEELQNLKILTDFRSKNCNGISYENF